MMERIFLRRQSGVTLIELMLAMVLGLLVAAGMVTVFSATSSSNRAQNQVARLQEEGRFAITRLGDDLRMANGQYCTNTGGVATPSTSGLLLDSLRAPKIYANDLLGALSDVTTAWGTAPYPAKPTASYYLPSFLSMRGYECTKTACTPTAPAGAMIPAMGINIGDRIKGTDVLTLRYLDSSRGWAVGGSSFVTTAADGTIASITLSPGGGEPPVSDFKPGDLALLANCANAEIFAVTGPNSSNQLSPNAVGTGPTANLGKPVAQQPQSAPRLFDFNTDFATVTYYLQVVDSGNGSKTGALIRRVNGTDAEIVRGVERMDFLYGVEDSDGNTRYLSANEVDSGTNCPPSVPIVLGTDPGCLWRGVKNIEVRILMDGQQPLHTLGANEMKYSYAADGNTVPVSPDDSSRNIKPSEQGFVNQMIRREFNALFSVRNYNP
jgi:type IV pilus assembly protein PilW